MLQTNTGGYMYKNNEGYPDTTAGEAIRNADKPPRHVMDAVYILRSVASLAGYEIIGRVELKDKKTGKEWR